MRWKDRAYALFFAEGKSVSAVAAAVVKKRETVSRYVNRLPEYGAEMARRRERSGKRRKDYKRAWNAAAREAAAAMRREHDLAASILSRERHCHK